jgi:hypothetical protein
VISNLRILGILLGFIGMLVTFLRFRGARWHRKSFVLLSLASIIILGISLDPDLLNLTRDVFLFKDVVYGRVLALLVLSTLFLLIFVFYLYEKIEKMKSNADVLFRSLSLMELEHRSDIKDTLRPITILIPAYNEADNLRLLLPRLPKQIAGLDVGVLVVDDGSRDGTREVLDEFGVPYLRNIVNRGQGAASRLGYNLLKLSKGVRIGVTMDADNQHRPEDLETLIRPILDGSCDLVIGSRRLGETKSSSLVRNLGVVVFSGALSFIIGVKLTDCSSGFKSFSRRWMDSVTLLEDQFQSTEVLIATVKKGLRVGEVPITIENRPCGESKKGTDLRYGLQVAKVLVKSWWRS